MKRRTLILFLCAAALPCLAAPSLRVAYFPATGVASLYWTVAPGAANYDVERTSAYPNWSFVTRLSAATTFFPQTVAANTAYLYRVVPRDASGNAMAASNAAIISTHNHTTNPLATNDPIKLENILELRTVVASVRVAAGAGTPAWTRPTLTTGSGIAAVDLTDLRASLNAAATNVGLPAPSYVDPSLAGQTFKHQHFQQLRDLARAYPEQVASQTASVSEAFFSPNADGAKDTTTFAAAVSFAGPRGQFRWRVDVRNAASAVVRSAYGNGAPIQFVWDGRNDAGVLQPEALYIFELVDLDSLPLAVASATARLDVTAPTATITSPVDGFFVSNVRNAGSGDVTVNGTAKDETALDQWALDRVEGALIYPIVSSTTSVNAELLATWQTLPPAGALPNGGASIRLTVVDQAGNRSTKTVSGTIGHFTVTRSASQVNAGTGGTVSYTSIVPFVLTEKLELRGPDGTIARTLVNAVRGAGTYADTWDLKNDQALLVGDGLYRYVATATEGASVLTWDRSNVFPSTGATQYPYPKCWNGTAWVACSTQTGFPFDPYAGTPLRIAYCVGTGEPESGCNGTAPALVVVKTTAAAETTFLCDAGCLVNEYQPAGRSEFRWYGTNTFGNWAAENPRLTVIRRFDQVSDNATLVYGTAPVIQSVTIEPRMFSPGSTPTPVGGQAITLNLTRFASRPVTVTAAFRNLTYNLTPRTITTAAQSADQITITWDGRADNNGPLVAPGTYEVTLVVKDSHGSQTIIRPLTVVRY